MPTWLLKTEPGEYSFEDLTACGPSIWDGVSNPAARIHLRAFAKGDAAFIYHTGSQKAIVGLAKVTRSAFEDPKRPGRNDRGEPLYPVVEVAPVKPARTILTLSAMREDPDFKGFDLLRLSRLSVVSVPAAIDRAIRRITGL